MTNNTQEIKVANRNSLLELILKGTDNCTIQWALVQAGLYQAESAPYTFNLSRLSGDILVLDVEKNDSLFRSYDSGSYEQIAVLLAAVESSVFVPSETNKLRALSELSGQLVNCHTHMPIGYHNSATGGAKMAGVGFIHTPTDYTDTASGGVECSGFGFNTKLKSATFLPINLTDSIPNPFPWIGTASDIDDVPDVFSHDSDATVILQHVTGIVGSHEYAPIFIYFPIEVPFSAPFKWQVRIAHKAPIGSPGLKLDFVVNDIPIALGVVVSPQPNSGWQIFSTNVLDLTGIVGIDSMTVRLKLNTNAASIPTSTAEINVSAVNVIIYGFA